MAPITFVICSLVWGFAFQPAVLNRCHLTLWLLAMESFRNLFTVESHATFEWGHATLGKAYQSETPEYSKKKKKLVLEKEKFVLKTFSNS